MSTLKNEVEKVFSAPTYMQFSISHVLFQKWLGPLPSIIICLPLTAPADSSQNTTFVSAYSMPRPKFGLLAWGVYRVPLSLFPERLRHCGTFKPTLAYPKT